MKSGLPYIILLILSLLLGCSDPLKPDYSESVVGTYRLSGKQINLRYCYLGGPGNCSIDEVIESDTLDVSFEMKIKPVPNKKDTIWVSGLEGADVSVQNAEFSGGGANPNCSFEKDCPYVKLVGETLKFDMNTWGYRYYGTGTIVDGKMSLNTYYRYRPHGVHYILEGEKIE